MDTTRSDPSASPVLLQILPRLRSGGVERGTLDIAIAAKRAGFISLVASAGGMLVPQLNKAGVLHFQLPLYSKNPFTMWRNIRRLQLLIDAYKVNILHARSRAPAWSAYFAARDTSCTFITTFHGIYRFPSELKRRYNAIMARGKRVIAVSRFVVDHIAGHYPEASGRVVLIHRGADPDLFNPDAVAEHRITDVLAKWRVPDGLPVILLPARLARWKGQEYLIAALHSLRHRNFFCVLLGDDMGHATHRRELEQHIISSGLEGHVRIASPITDMPAAYMAASVVVSASIEPEAFGRVTIEAQMMGRPIIATAHGGSLETIVDNPEDQRTGWLVEPGNVLQLAAAIDRALSLSIEERSLLAARARTHVVAHFTTKQMVDRTISVYKEMLKPRMVG